MLGNHTFAIISGHEDYQHLKNGFAPVLEDINALISQPTLHVNDQELQLSIVLGGDYKVSLIINVAFLNYTSTLQLLQC